MTDSSVPAGGPEDVTVTAALAMLEAGRYEEAETALRTLAAAAPARDAGPRSLMGRLLLQRGAWADALPWLEQARHAAPADDEIAFELGWCLFKLDRPAEAAAVLEPIQARPDAALLLGRAWLEAGRAAEALAPLEACGLPAAELPAGWCHYVAGRPAAAAACWERWMRAGAADWGTKDALATFLFLLGGGPRPSGRPERPAEPLRDMDLWFRLLVRYGRWDDVEAAIARGPALDQTIWRDLRSRWATTLKKAGRPAEASRLLDDEA